MDAMTAVGSPRFGFTKPPIGKSKGAVTVGPSTVTIEHPLFKQAVEVPIGNVIVVPVEGTAVALPLLTRDPKLVRLGVTQYTEANLALVFRQPVPFGRSKWGSQQLTGMKARERRRGLDVDVVTLSLADPALALAELRSRGAGEAPTLADALAGVIGVPEGLELEARKQKVAKARRRMYRGLVAWGVLSAVLLPLRFAVESELPMSRLLHIGASTLVWATLSGFITLSQTGHRRDASGPPALRPKPSPRRILVRGLAVTLGPLAVLVGAFAWAASLSGASQTVALGAVLGLPGGVVLVLIWRSASAIRNASDPLVQVGVPSGFRPYSPPPPVSTLSVAPAWAFPPPPPTWPGGPVDAAVATPKRRLRRTVGVGLAWIVGVLAVLVVVGLIVQAVDRLPDDGLAGRATVTAADLPADWTAYSGAGAMGRSSMDDHICGNASHTLPDHSGGYRREFGYKLVDDRELAHLDVGVLISPTVAAAEQEFAVARENGPAYQSCVEARAIQLSGIGSPKTTGPSQISISRATIDGIPGVVDRITVTTPTLLSTRVTHVAFVRLQIDRVIVRMPITTWGRPMSDARLLPIIRAEQQKVEAALAADT